MKKLAALLFFISSLPLYAQEYETAKIKQLKKNLVFQKGAARIDAMIAICEGYFGSGFFGDKDPRTDSMSKYASMAKREAEKSNNQQGVSNAMVFSGFIKMLRQDYPGVEKELGFVLAQNKASENLMGHANNFMGAMYADFQNDLDKGQYYFKKGLAHFQKAHNEFEEAMTCTRIGMLYKRKGDFEIAVEYFGKGAKAAQRVIASGRTGGWIDYLFAMTWRNLADLYRMGGDYPTAREYLKEFRSYGVKRGYNISINYDLAVVYKEEGKYDSALYYLKLNNSNLKEITILRTLGETYLAAKEYAVALGYLQPLVDSFRNRIGKPNAPRAKLNMLELLLSQARAYYELGNHAEANRPASEALQLLNETRQSYLPVDQYELFANAYQFTGKADSALTYFQKYRLLRDSIVSRQFLFKLNNLKKVAEDEKKEAQMALLEKENSLKEEQLKQQALVKEQKEIALSLLDKDIKLLNNENKFKEQQLKQEGLQRQEKEAMLALMTKNNKIKEQQLKQEAFYRNVLYGGVIALVILGLSIVRTQALKRRNEILQREKTENELRLQQMENQKKQAEFQQQAAELEMQALRAQMNPHFIFNCLSSINWLILENNAEAASDYLTRFSKLIRMVLINSEKSLISLEEELKMLQLYLEMEKLRFENTFDYKISYPPDMSTDSIPVPPLLLQPFCENAIWHGLMHLPVSQAGNGKLTVEINEENKVLYFTVTDNGVGRQKAFELSGNKSAKKYKSMGLKITAERLALFNEKRGAQTFYEIEDLIDKNGQAAGTRVMIKIKNHNSLER